MSIYMRCAFAMQHGGATYGTDETPGLYVPSGLTWDTTNKLNGLASANTGNGVAMYMNMAYSEQGAIQLGVTYSYRAYFRFNQAPSLRTKILQWGSPAKLNLQLHTDRTVRLWDAVNSAAVGGDSAALAVDTTHCLEVQIKIAAAGNATVSLRVNGITVVDGATPALGNTVYGFWMLGDYNGENPGISCKWGFLAINSSSGTDNQSWVGESKAYLMVPGGLSGVTGWVGGAGGAAAATAIDNIPPTGDGGSPTDANTLKAPNANATDAFTVATASSFAGAGVPAGYTIRLVQPIIQMGNSDTTNRQLGVAMANPSVAEAVGSTTNGPSAAAGAVSTNWRMLVSARAVDPSPASIDRAQGVSVTIRRATATAGTVFVDFVGVLVEAYVGGPIGQAVETDTAQRMYPPTRIAQAVETDTSQGMFTWTNVAKYLSGKITSDDMASIQWTGSTYPRAKWRDYLASSGDGSVPTGAATVSVGSGMLLIQATNTSRDHAIRGIFDGTSKAGTGPAPLFTLGLKSAIVSIDVLNAGGNNGSAWVGLMQDASNGYLLEVGNGSAGPSKLWEMKAGVLTERGSVAKGAASGGSWVRATLRRSKNTLSAIVDGSAIAAWTDPAPLTGLVELRLGGPNNGSGLSSWWYFRALDVAGGREVVEDLTDEVIVHGVPAGGSVQLLDATDAAVKTANEAAGGAGAGQAHIDMSDLPTPFTGYLQVCAGAAGASPILRGWYPEGVGTTPARRAVAEIRAGDQYFFNLTSHTVWGTEYVGQYGTTQIGSHNGIIKIGTDQFSAQFGRSGSVLVSRRSTLWPAGKPSEITVVEAEGFIWDQHANIDIQRDTAGYLHLWYGNSHYDEWGYYRKSTAPGVATFGAAVQVAKGLDCALLIDQADVLYLLGTQALLPGGYGGTSIVSLKNSTGTWGSPKIIANSYHAGADNIDYFLGDATIGKEPSGQQSLVMTLFAYKYGQAAYTGYLNLMVLRSTDADANWKGLTGGNFTLPLSMNSAGTISDANAIAQSGSPCYVGRLCVDSDLSHVHVVMFDFDLGYARYKRGTIGTGWAAWSQSFSWQDSGAGGRLTQGAIEQVPSGELVFVTSSVNPNGLVRWRSSSVGVSWSLMESTLTGETYYPPVWYWPKLTKTPGNPVVTCYWQARGTSMTSNNSTVTGEGSAALYTADVFGLLGAVIGQAVETDTAHGATVVVRPTLGQAQEVDSTHTMTRGGVHAVIGQATENDSALAMVAVVSSGGGGSSWTVRNTYADFQFNAGTTTGALTNQNSSGDIDPRSPLPA